MNEVTVASDVTGSVWKVLVVPGAQVAAEQPLLIVESMKMEIEVLAPAAGEVAAILVREGDLVEEDQALVLLRTAA